jgi:hypothetical protein
MAGTLQRMSGRTAGNDSQAHAVPDKAEFWRRVGRLPEAPNRTNKAALNGRARLSRPHAGDPATGGNLCLPQVHSQLGLGFVACVNLAAAICKTGQLALGRGGVRELSLLAVFSLSNQPNQVRFEGHRPVFK